MSHIFISYDPTDSKFIHELKSWLETARITYQLAEECSWNPQIEEDIAAAKVVIAVLSPASCASPTVTYEWAYAVGRGRPIIPLIVRATDPHPRLKEFAHLDFTKRPHWNALLIKLQALMDSYATASLHKTRPLNSITVATSGHKSTPALVADLMQKDEPDLRRQAAETLGQQRERDAFSQLMMLLNDSDATVQTAAIKALGRIRDARATAKLSDLLVNDDDGRVRTAAAEALWSLEDRHAAGSLRGALTDKCPDVRKFAAYTLGTIKDADSLPLLVDLLEDDDVFVRAAVATALGQIGDYVVTKILCYRLRHDTSAIVRGAIAHALGKIGDRGAIQALQRALSDEYHVSNAAGQALAQIQTEKTADSPPALNPQPAI